jgi:hypothetical protein
MNTVSIILRRAAWLIPFLILGSVASCVTPFVLAFLPLDSVMMFLGAYVVYLTFLAVLIVGVLFTEWIRRNNEHLG